MVKDFNAEVGARVKELRCGQGLTREKLAEAAEISTQFLSDIEFGRKGMGILTLKKLCVALRVSADYIIFGREAGGETLAAEELLKQLNERQLKCAEKIIKIILEAAE